MTIIKMKKIITLDFECYVENNIHYPFAIGIYYDNTFKFFYLNERDNFEELVTSCLEHLMLLKDLNQYLIYVHNMSKYDSLFIFKYINLDIFKIRAVATSSDIYKIVIKKGKKLINMVDSYKIINMSLKEAAVTFNKDTFKKEIDYSKFKRNNINDEILKMEILSYLKADVKCLYEIMDNFTNKVYDKWGLCNSKYLSISGLSLKIFMNNYLKDKIENTYKLYNTIDGYKNAILRDSYFGGRTEVYKPYLENGYVYDVNSLYPYVMKEFDYPIGEGE